MRKIWFVFLVFILSLCCFSCYSTKIMLNNVIVADTEKTIDEKMELLGFPKVSLSNIESFFDGPDWVSRLIELIRESKEYIIFTSFLASECEENEEVYNLLCSKAEEGVKIYFISDSSGALDMTSSRFHIKPLNRLRESGIHFLEYNPFSFNRLPKLAKLFLREHRKFFVFDGEMVAVGGMNLNYISNISYKIDGQRDTMFCFYSPSAATYLLKEFIDFWNIYSWEEIRIEDFNFKKETQETNIPSWVINQDEFNNTMPSLMGSLFSSAKSEILILPLMPLEDKTTIQVIKNAVDRGVDVQMILPNDPRESVFKAAHFSVSKLIKTGMNIFSEPNDFERKQLLHEKLIIVDSEYVLIGSINLNYRSLVLANEIGILIKDKEFATFMRNHFYSLKENTTLLTEEDAKEWDSFLWKLSYFMHFITG